MQKFIHCADIHLGSKMESKLPREKVKERRVEVRATFRKMVEYAKENGVRAILLSGDVFDSDRPLRDDKAAFYKIVRDNPDLKVIALAAGTNVRLMEEQVREFKPQVAVMWTEEA